MGCYNCSYPVKIKLLNKTLPEMAALHSRCLNGTRLPFCEHFLPKEDLALVDGGDGGFFVKATSMIADGDNPSQRYSGISITENLEIFVAAYGGKNLLLRWDKTSGRMINIAAGTPLEDDGGFAMSTASCDLDGDGVEELYLHNSDAKEGKKSTVVCDMLFKKVKSKGWTNMLEKECSDETNLIAGRSVGCLDRFGEGTYGMVLSGYGGPTRLHEYRKWVVRNDKGDKEMAGFITDDNTAAAGLTKLAKDSFTQSMLIAPILNTKTDIFVGNDKGDNWFFENLGNAQFKDTLDSLIPADTTRDFSLADPKNDPRGMCVFDENMDGLLDILVINWNDMANSTCDPVAPKHTQHRLFHQTPDRKFKDVTAAVMPVLMEYSRAKSVVCADFDNDGLEDVFVQTAGCVDNEQPNKLYSRFGPGGSWVQVKVGEAREKTGRGVAAAVSDLDRDGLLEMVLTHGATGSQPLTIYKASGDAASNNWVRVAALTRMGAPARGTLVQIVEASGRKQTRVIDSGGAYFTQSEPIAHFGLGKGGKISSVKCTFPGGQVVSVPVETSNEMVMCQMPEEAPPPEVDMPAKVLAPIFPHVKCKESTPISSNLLAQSGAKAADIPPPFTAPRWPPA